MSATVTEPRVVVVTPMQRKVIGELARDGAVDAVIAERLGISPWTAKSHMRAALKAMGSENRTALVVELLRGRVRLRVVSNSGAHLRKEGPA